MGGTWQEVEPHCPGIWFEWYPDVYSHLDPKHYTFVTRMSYIPPPLNIKTFSSSTPRNDVRQITTHNITTHTSHCTHLITTYSHYLGLHVPRVRRGCIKSELITPFLDQPSLPWQRAVTFVLPSSTTCKSAATKRAESVIA